MTGRRQGRVHGHRWSEASMLNNKLNKTQTALATLGIIIGIAAGHGPKTIVRGRLCGFHDQIGYLLLSRHKIADPARKAAILGLDKTKVM